MSEPSGGRARSLIALEVLRVVACVVLVHRHFYVAALGSGLGTRFATMAELVAWGEPYRRWYDLTDFSSIVAIRVFFFLSAFGLTYSALRSERVAWGPWLRRRLLRLYPSFVVAGLFLIAFHMALALGQGRPPGEALLITWPQVLWNMLGGTFLAGVPPLSAPWWFNGVILSFYVVFPLLLWVLRRSPWAPFFLGCVLMQWALFEGRDLWPGFRDVFRAYRSDFVGCRLVELSAGMVMGALVHRGGPGILERLSSPRALAGLSVLAAASFAAVGLGLGDLPHALEPLRAIAVSLAVYGWLSRLPDGLLQRVAKWSPASLMVYLVHMDLAVAAASRLRGHLAPYPLVFLALVPLLWLLAMPLQALAGRLAARLPGS